MAHRRKFTAEFKAQVVLDLVSGAKSAAELCREHQLNPQLLARWKSEFVERAPLLFQQEAMQSREQEREIVIQSNNAIIERARRFVACQRRVFLETLVNYYKFYVRYGKIGSIIPELFQT